MKQTSIRSIVTMMVIFFAVAATSCQKESEIVPANPTTPTAPTIPVTPVTPAVSMRPVNIITTENGSAVRKEIYRYDAQGKLTHYVSSGTPTSDSVIISANTVVFKKITGVSPQVLNFNADKTFKSLVLASLQGDFQNNQTKLGSFTETRSNGTPVTVANFIYTGSNLTRINTEIRIDFNYYNNLPYQRGINEIPLPFKPTQYYKLMEQENLTTTTLYDKLLRQVIINRGANSFETHEYVYVFDSNNRVTQITDTITKTTSTTSTQKVLVSTIT